MLLHQLTKQHICYTISFSGVNPLVSNKIRPSAKGFLTVTALIRSFPSVNPLVLNEVRLMGEEFATFATLVRLFSTVASLVLN